MAEKIVSRKIKAETGILISNRADSLALEKAVNLGMKSFWVDPRKFPGRDEHEEEMVRLLKEYGTDLVVAAGYMRILGSRFISAFRNRIINIHPSLLPAFPGVDAQKQALDYGVKITGCTTHFIDEGTDTGPIIMQAAIPVDADETVSSISQKILREEHRILQESVQLFCENRLTVEGRKVNIR